ncbi:MAG TPA: hypothetical protein IAC41_00955 [Candidatus Merdenecus merdavium]|nr:hypothetical protein [Candidatus Merdenecus merdavium]
MYKETSKKRQETQNAAKQNKTKSLNDNTLKDVYYDPETARELRYSSAYDDDNIPEVDTPHPYDE